MPHCHRRGFTLVELAIVLVILGLIVGGVISGQALIESTRLKSVIREANQYKTAVAAFKDQYSALPGDMPTAVRYWGLSPDGDSTDDGANAACLGGSTPIFDTRTCNGDGSGLIGDQMAAATASEIFGFWKHLSNAGLIEGSYTGVPASNTLAFGTNVPESRVRRAGWSVLGISNPAAWNYLFPIAYGNALFFGALDGPAVRAQGPVIKAPDAEDIDTKMDDGLPGRGTVLSFNHTGRSNCVTSNDVNNSEYALNNAAVGCNLVFLTGF